jgi:hypothetical protein
LKMEQRRTWRQQAFCRTERFAFAESNWFAHRSSWSRGGPSALKPSRGPSAEEGHIH